MERLNRRNPLLLAALVLFACIYSIEAIGEEVLEIKGSLTQANNCQKVFRDINYYLFDNVKSGDTELNLKAALELLTTQKKSYFSNKSLVECVELFTSLSHIQPRNRCNRNSYTILVKNSIAVGRGLESRLTAPRRIDTVFNDVCVNHAKDCLNIYPLIFKLKYKKMNYILVQRVETFINELMYSTSYDVYKRCNKQTIYDNFIAKPVSIDGSADADIAYEAMKILSSDDPDRKYLQKYSDEREGRLVLSEGKIRDLFRKYLVEPCQYFIRELGPDVFGPATFDDQFELKTRDLEFADLHYFRSWARYRFCVMFIYQDREFLIREVIKIAQNAKW